MRLELIEQFRRRAREAPDVLALRQAGSPTTPERRVTRGELVAWIDALAARLMADTRPGDVVLICSPNRPEFSATFLAALSVGLRAFPVAPELAEPELISAATRSGATAIIGEATALDVLRGHVRTSIQIDTVAQPPRATTPPDTTSNFLKNIRMEAGGLLLLSSGTTGQPKIVFRDAASLDAVSEAMAMAVGFRESDHVLACVPLCHSYGIEHGLLAPTWAGSAVHLTRGFDLRVALRELSGSGATIFPGVPFMFEMLAEHGGRNGAVFPWLRRAYSAGAPLPNAVAQAFRQHLGVTVSQLYGATEIGSVTYADPDLPGFDPASVGRAMKGVSIRILAPDARDASSPLPTGEQGHVAVSAESMLHSYLGDEQPPATIGGYFPTGDLGRLDELGNLTITGRIKLLIDVGGLKVNPLEVEQVLAEHPAVATCVVVPVRVSETVSRLKAIVTPRPDAPGPPEPASLRALARSRLAGYKVPRVFEVRDRLPTSATGKILRHLVEA
jgi:acyl-CoA synthetase (AMP-forming)/AMP-acid ligase II